MPFRIRYSASATPQTTDPAESIPIHLGDNPKDTSCYIHSENLPEVANVQPREYLPDHEYLPDLISHLPELSPEQQH